MARQTPTGKFHSSRYIVLIHDNNIDTTSYDTVLNGNISDTSFRNDGPQAPLRGRHE